MQSAAKHSLPVHCGLLRPHSDNALPPRLLYEEYRVRQLYGDKPTVDRYEVRFPKQFAELQKLLAQQPIASPFCTPTLASVEPMGRCAAGVPVRLG